MPGEATISGGRPGEGAGVPANLIEVLRARALGRPARISHRFLSDDGEREVSFTYSELDRRARAVGAWLQESGAAGGRVLLLLPPGLEYVAGFFGCLYAGAVAVPAYPPRANRSLERLHSIAVEAEASAALTSRQILSKLTPALALAPALSSLRWAATEEVEDGRAELWREPEATRETLAFLQFTSGSTANPRGVMVSHGNLLHNEEMIRRAFGQDERSVIVGWLPLYHDMGLIGNVLQPLYVGAECVLMSPVSFLQKPLRWLQAVSRFRATTSGGPNFAYDLCVRKTTPEERASLDLSSWRVAFNGAEPVRAETLRRFAEAFAPCGFRASAFQPCYGLAEATLLVTAAARDEGPAVVRVAAGALEQNRVVEEGADGEGVRALVGCGGASHGQSLLVVNPETLTPCGPSEVGEIWVGGPSVAGGYWRRPEETAHAFGAYLRETGEGPFLRTGDLGFLRAGELFVTGRLKDLLIVRGRNLYPQDIERTAEESHAALRPGCGAAFAVEVAGEERVVVVQEVERGAGSRHLADALADVRRALGEEHDLQAHAVLLVKANSIAKTSSGKVRRRACREMFLRSEFEPLAEWREAGTPPGDAAADASGESPAPPSSPSNVEEVTSWLRARLAARLGLDAADIETACPVTRYGLDSLSAVEMSHAVETELGASLTLTSFLEGRSIAELAEEVARQTSAGSREEARAGRAADAAVAGDSGPLSHGQKALWLLHRMAPESGAYNVARAARVRGELDAESLRRAFQALAQRHAALRTTFEFDGGEPASRVHEDLPVDFASEDATSWGEAEVGARLGEEARRPFDLAAGPLLRVRLLKRAAGEHTLLIVVHHIVSDFWSLAVMLGELGDLYRAALGGAPTPPAPPGVGYADYVRWQTRLLEGPEGERLWSYWRGQLAGLRPLDMPSGRPRPPAQTYVGASHAFRLGAELTARLRALGREHSATLYTTLLAAFNVLLSRYTGQRDLAVGTPTAGRARPEFSDVVGYFVNPVVVRSDLSGDPRFGDFLERTRRAVLDAFAHQDYPFALLVQRLQPERDASRSPLFQAMFVLQQTQRLREEGVSAFALGEVGARLRVGGLELESMTLDQRVAQFDLSLSVAETGDTLLASLEYNTDLFDPHTIRRLAAHYRTLLEGIAAGPRRRLSQLPLLTEDERRQILRGWNDTAADLPTDTTLHELFERQAATTPEAAALTFGGETLSYRELDERADRLARHLAARGVGPETPVGLLLERSAGMVVGLLGVLKAGGAYVPLDPEYPAARLSWMVADAGAALILTRAELAGRLGQGCGARVVLLTEGGEVDGGGAGGGDERPRVEVTPDNLAYVIYTSGSTGRPKAAMNTHRAVLNRLLWMQEQYRLTSADTVLQKTPYGFDVSVWEFFWPLLTGARLVVSRPGGHRDSAYLREVIEAEGVTALHFVPSMLGVFLSSGVTRGGRCASVRLVVCSGEALGRELVGRYWGEWGAGELENLYGPTEAAVDVTRWGCPRGEAPEVIPIGRPVSNTQIYVLDENLESVPVGVSGELYIGGVQVGRGYLNRPGLTAERFIPDPFSAEPGARLYRTGDVGRYLPGGEVEYVGRADQQVKVRGFRIELGEIEAALEEHGRVRECVVTAGDDGRGGKRLVAYVVAEPGAAAGGESGGESGAGLRRFLRERLPEYMLPSAFVTLEALPLSPNGKVDRKALPAPRFGQEPGAFYAAPRTQTEEIVCDICAAVLGARGVGVDDNFFESGGHSLLAAQLVARVHEVFGVELPLRQVFEAPTAAGLAAAIDVLTSAGAARAASPVRRVARTGELPLSFAQQRLWFLDQLEPGSAVYNIPAAIRLRGRLERAALERGLGHIVNRHEALRTTFNSRDGQPVQVIAPPAPWGLPLVDLSALADHAREREARRLVEDEARRPFDLAAGPMLRAALLRLSEEEHVLSLTLHHIAGDGWSVGVLVRELMALYEAFGEGQPSPLPELPIQYADFAAWQRERLQGEVLDAQLAYWKRKLGGRPPVLELPSDRADRARPHGRATDGATEPFSLPKRLGEELKELSRREGATLFMTLLAAFQTLLHRYTGHRDITVGTPVAGRSRVETEPLIGFFANTLVMRGDLSGDPSFEELLRRVREVALEAHAHQDVPFEMLVEELQPERDLSHTPLFQVMLVLQNAPLPEVRLAGLGVEHLPAESGAARFDLTVFFRETEDGLAGLLEYRTDSFEPSAVRRIAAHFRVLLESIAADPRRRLSELTLLTEDERRQLLVGWNDTRRDYPRGLCLHETFERQAAETADATALVCGRRRLTYEELNRRSDALAVHLQSLGVAPETAVGVLLERGVELIVALLGVLKAGGAYVPLDPAYPRERLAFMLEDARSPVLLTQESMAGLLPARGAHVVRLDAEWETVTRPRAERPRPAARADNLAYLIYTSGSTGRPKGVAIEHRSAVTLLRWAHEVFDASELEGVLASTSVCFDLSIFEIFVPLACGGKVILAANALEVPALEAAGEVTLVNTVPSAMTELVRMEDGVPPSVRVVNLAGEPLKNSLVQQVYGRGTVARVFNLYGPSEDTTYSTFALTRKGVEQAPSIGRPVANTQVYVLDAGMRPVPVGVTGELYVAGDGLARGYLNRPALTAEMFLPSPFSDEPGARLYKTGDLARWLPDGEIDFLGRIDHQVKIRGHRIELGEIEELLAGHAGLRESVVVARDDEEGGRRLVAYVVAHEGVAPTPGELRAFLKERLPEYMLPSAFVLLDELPLTPNGKVDRKALPAPEHPLADDEVAFIAPRTPTEEALAEMWARLLGRRRVGVHDNFFDLGGHSLLATQIISRVRGEFGVELPLRALFKSATVASLAELVELARHAPEIVSPAPEPDALSVPDEGVDLAEKVELFRRATQELMMPPIVPAARDSELPLSFAQQRLWFLDQLTPGSFAYNLMGGMRLSGALDVGALGRAFGEVVRRHEAVRTSFTTVDGWPVQVIQAWQGLELPVEDLRDVPDEEREAAVQQRAAAELRRPFDLSQPPLLRARLLRLAETEHVVLLTMHHIVSDGWSIGILVEEVTTLYESFRLGEDSPLPELPIQYADFAAWQRERLQGEVLDAQLAYWKRKLAGTLPVVEVPPDRPRPESASLHVGAKFVRRLPSELYDALRALSCDEEATLYMTLLAAFNVLLYKRTGQDDVVVGTAIAGRTHAEVERLIGVFINMLVLRTDVSGNPKFRELLARVREVALGAYAHQDMPFEKLVDELQPGRAMSQTPFFRIAFGLQNAPVRGVRLPALTLSPVAFENELARYDLTLWMLEGEDGLSASWTYSTELYDAAAIARLHGHYETLLRGVVASPDARLSALEMLTEEERRRSVLKGSEWEHAGAQLTPTRRKVVVGRRAE